MDKRKKNYYLKNGVGLVGTFYVGWEQITNDLLNIGLDKNSISNQYMFYNVGGGWVNSQFPGSWMIRPVVNFDEALVSSEHQINLSLDFQIFPNPFIDYTSIYFSNQNHKTISVIDMMGRNVKSLYTSERTINIYKEDEKIA